jgi:hypothetical protein
MDGHGAASDAQHGADHEDDEAHSAAEREQEEQELLLRRERRPEMPQRVEQLRRASRIPLAEERGRQIQARSLELGIEAERPLQVGDAGRVRGGTVRANPIGPGPHRIAEDSVALHELEVRRRAVVVQRRGGLRVGGNEEQDGSEERETRPEPSPVVGVLHPSRTLPSSLGIMDLAKVSAKARKSLRNVKKRTGQRMPESAKIPFDEPRSAQEHGPENSRPSGPSISSSTWLGPRGRACKRTSKS